MLAGERIDAIKRIATALSSMEWLDIDLILRQHKIPTDNWYDQNRYAYAIAMLQECEDRQLSQLDAYLNQRPVPPSGLSQWEPGTVRLFASHLAVQKDFVGDCARALEFFGVNSFVAHSSITPSDDWRNVIEASLMTCDVMVTFIHPGFHESAWCEQEVGFALARGVPLLPLALGEMPLGFHSARQARPCENLSAHEIATSVLMPWLVALPGTQEPLAEGLTTALERVNSFASARRVFNLLSQLEAFAPAQLSRLKTAATDNDQVAKAVTEGWGMPMPQAIDELIARHGGIPTAAPDPWSDDPPF